MFREWNTPGERTGRRGHSQSARCSKARSRSWMNLSPSADCSPVVEGKLVRAAPSSGPLPARATPTSTLLREGGR